ncbi:MAG: dethiobiotin synthase [Micromonosporaceae bacterium]
MRDWRGLVIVTGTDTGVGKTVVTAALAAAAGAAGVKVAMLKPAQTGLDDDAAEVARLAAPATVRTLVHYPDPLAPLVAARAAQQPPLPMTPVVRAATELDRNHDLVLIEGAGGLLVPLGASTDDGPPWTIAELALALGAPAVVVARAGLGTLNHTALTIEALSQRATPASIVIGAWPRQPGLADRNNREDLAEIAPVIGVLPEATSDLDPYEFRRAAPTWFDAGHSG